jgi:hypothetical protein
MIRRFGRCCEVVQIFYCGAEDIHQYILTIRPLLAIGLFGRENDPVR